MNFKKISLGYC